MSGLKDMAKSPEEMSAGNSISPTMLGQEKYPYGLRICLTHEELEKLDVDKSDWEVGDVFHLHAFAKVVSVSENETEGGKNCRVELQITHLAGPENEDEEDSEEEDEDGEPEENEGKSEKSRYLKYD